MVGCSAESAKSRYHDISVAAVGDEDMKLDRRVYMDDARRVQSSGLQVSVRHGSTVPSEALRADVNSHQLASSIRSLRPIDCSTQENKLQRSQLRRPRTSSVEQSSC